MFSFQKVEVVLLILSETDQSNHLLYPLPSSSVPNSF